jgi:hypothetical protein
VADPLKQVDLHDDRHTTSTDVTGPIASSRGQSSSPPAPLTPRADLCNPVDAALVIGGLQRLEWTRCATDPHLDGRASPDECSCSGAGAPHLDPTAAALA